MAGKPTRTFVFPCTVLIDRQEQAPYRFEGIRADAADGCQPPGAALYVPTRTVRLRTGDYSLEGYEDKVTVERKSLADLYSTVSQGRERFKRELERMRSLLFAAVVIEASYGQILACPPPFTDYAPKSVMRSILAWMQRYRVHFVPCDDRRLAEVVTFRMLQRFRLERGESCRRRR